MAIVLDVAVPRRSVFACLPEPIVSVAGVFRLWDGRSDCDIRPSVWAFFEVTGSRSFARRRGSLWDVRPARCGSPRRPDNLR